MNERYFVGIDVAQAQHRIAVVDADGETVGKSFAIEASRKGFETLVRTLQERGARPGVTVIGLEASGHLWENLEAYLGRAGYRVLVLNPLQTRRYREVLHKRAKTDDVDAYVIAGLLRSGEAEASYVADEQIQSLRELARLRARLMRERQDYLRQLLAQLEVVFPEYRALLSDLLSARARGLLRAFPTAYHLAQASVQAIQQAARAAGARSFTEDDAATLREAAKRSTYSGKAAEARGQVIRTLVEQIERLNASIEDLDAAMQGLLTPPEQNPTPGPSDVELLLSLPGIGPQTAAVLLGELGPLTRFTDAKALVAYVGFYPVILQSGERTAPARLATTGSRIARHALYLAAVNAIRRSVEFRTLYLRKRSQGKTAKQALITVAVKLLHTAYAMLKHRVPFNPSRLLVAGATIRA